MKTFFAWKTIEHSLFEKEIFYLYGSPVAAGEFSSWNSMHEALELRVTITPRATMPDIMDYIQPGEQTGIILRWAGDNKFSGCSPVVPFDFPSPSTIQCNIPKGSCAIHFHAECNLIVYSAPGEDPRVRERPPGSVIAVIPILENVRIGKGSVFPLWEFDGDGRNLIQWDFSSNEDLENSLMSALTVIVDRTHSLINKAEYTINKPFVNLMIIQQFARKAFNPGIFEQLIVKQRNNEPWAPDSLGSSFNAILKKICTVLNIETFQTLKDIYSESPEKIDQCVDTIFSHALKLQ
jgi:hypothetical protein